MGVDEPGQHDLAGTIDDGVGGCGQVVGGADPGDDAVLDEDPGAFQLSALPIHGDKDVGVVREEGRHS